MKKVISMLIVLIILSMSVVSQAALNLTENELDKALNEVCGYEKTIETKEEDKNGKVSTSTLSLDFKDFSYSIDKEKNIINLKMGEDGEYVINYNLENTSSPKFIFKLKYTKEMTNEELIEEAGRGFYLNQFLFCVIAKTEGILPEDSFSHDLGKVFDKFFPKMIEMQSSDTIANAKILYNEDFNLSNDYRKVVYQKESETDNEYVIKSILTINGNADFLKLEGNAKNLELESEIVKELENAMEGFASSIQENVNTNNQSDKVVDMSGELENAMEELASSIQENFKTNEQSNEVANINKIPKTGNGKNLVKALTGVIIVSIMIMVALAIHNRKKVQ